MKKKCIPSLAIAAALALGGTAHAATIFIDSQLQGCGSCAGPQDILPGTSVGIYSPKVQLTLGPGTYDFTNADPDGTDYYSAWNYEGYPSSTNWVWSFVVANDATGVVLMDDYGGYVAPTQATAADETGITTYDGNTVLSSTSIAGFTDTLTLASTTTLDFFIDDYELGDDGGGVALNIQPAGGSTAPEPSTLLLFGGAFAGVALWRRLMWRAQSHRS